MRRHIHIHKAPMKGRDALSHSQRMELQGLAKAAVGKKMTYAQFESSLGKRSMEEIEVAMRAYEAHETQATFERRGNRDAKKGAEAAAEYKTRASEQFKKANALAEQGKHAEAEKTRAEGERLLKLHTHLENGGEIV